MMKQIFVIMLLSLFGSVHAAPRSSAFNRGKLPTYAESLRVGTSLLPATGSQDYDSCFPSLEALSPQTSKKVKKGGSPVAKPPVSPAVIEKEAVTLAVSVPSTAWQAIPAECIARVKDALLAKKDAVMRDLVACDRMMECLFVQNQELETRIIELKSTCESMYGGRIDELANYSQASEDSVRRIVADSEFDIEFRAEVGSLLEEIKSILEADAE